MATNQCECGCGESTAPGKRFRKGHFSRTPANNYLPHPEGEGNPRWNPNPSYRTIHKWLCLKYPKSGTCVHCEQQRHTEYALIAGREYSRNREDYLELCRSCHRRYDRPEESRPRDALGRWS